MTRDTFVETSRVVSGSQGALARRGPVIDLVDLSKAFDRASVIDGVTLRIESGAYMALCGPSGSGKTTLLSIIGLLEDLTSGTYRLAGTDVKQLGDDQRSRLRNAEFGFVFQVFSLIPELPAWQNVARPLVHAGVARREQRERALHLLEWVGLADRAQHKPAQLSGGEQQRIAIARALVNEPSIILADEPTSNLPRSQWEPVIDVLERLRDQGKTIIVATHNPDVAERTNRVEWLAEGTLQRATERPRQTAVTHEPPIEAALEFRFLGGAEAWRSGQELKLQRRQVEILTLLAANPRGLTGEQLVLLLYGDDGRIETLKAAISRMRTRVPIASQPYRIDQRFRADFIDARATLRSGDLVSALDQYRGPLLPASEAPGIVALRDDLAATLRLAVLASPDADHLFRLAELLGDDLEVWEAASSALDRADPRSAVAQTNIERIKADWFA